MKIKPILFAGLLILGSSSRAATTFTEFYVGTGGDNRNGGSDSTNSAAFTSTNGNWDGTSLFIPTDGSNPSSFASVGQFASVYNDGATVAVYVSRVVTVTNAVNGGIILSTTAKFGTAPSSSATARSIKIGGAWQGPNGSDLFPMTIFSPTATDAAGDTPCVNLKGTNMITAGLSFTNTLGPVRWAGYTNTVRDGGKWVLDSTNTVGITMMSCSCTDNDFVDMIVSNSGCTSGTTDGISNTATRNSYIRIAIHDVRRAGITATSAYVGRQIEAYLCNKGNSSQRAAIESGGGIGTILIRTIAHDNSGSNGNGYLVNAAATLIGFIAHRNGKDGVLVTATTFAGFEGGICYSNAASGIDFTSAQASQFSVENVAFFANGAFGITSPGSSLRNGSIINSAVGTGSKANGSGDFDSNLGGMNISGTVTYASGTTPWRDPDNGVFDTVISAAGNGSYTTTQSGYGPTVAYPDIGIQHHNFATPHAYPFAQ